MIKIRKMAQYPISVPNDLTFSHIVGNGKTKSGTDFSNFLVNSRTFK